MLAPSWIKDKEAYKEERRLFDIYKQIVLDNYDGRWSRLQADVVDGVYIALLTIDGVDIEAPIESITKEFIEASL